jgi:Cft2 family RNA processing exonuclease
LQLAVSCKVEVLSFSAHADFGQTSGFLDALQPPHVVLVHGERGEMMKLRGVSLSARLQARRWVHIVEQLALYMYKRASAGRKGSSASLTLMKPSPLVLASCNV